MAKNVETAKQNVETTTKSTPVSERQYKLVAMPAVIKGKQRQIVCGILNESKKPMTIAEITPLAEKAGLKAIGGVAPSVRYHLHHMVLLKIAEVTNPTIA